jgi:hypothetical protein
MHRLFLVTLFTLYLYLLLAFPFLHGNEDVAFLDVGRWSRVSGHLLLVVT